MRSGTTTIKMISSTSTTSTSGVMLISDCRVEPESLLNCIFLLPFCGGAFGYQPDAPEAGLLDSEHGLPDLDEIELCVASYHDSGIRLAAHRRLQSFTEMVGCDSPIVDPQPTALVDRDQDSASF